MDLYDHLPDIYRLIYLGSLVHLNYCIPRLMPPKQGRKAPGSTVKTPNASWTDQETAALVTCLHEHRSETEGGGQFSAKTFQKALDFIRPLHVKGGEKDIGHLRRKWKSVRHNIFLPHVVAKHCSRSRMTSSQSRGIVAYQGLAGIQHKMAVFCRHRRNYLFLAPGVLAMVMYVFILFFLNRISLIYLLRMARLSNGLSKTSLGPSFR
jgi:hypothetical protein